MSERAASDFVPAQAGGQLFLDAIENISDAFYAMEPDWTIVAFNKAAHAYFGFGPERVLGRNFWDLFPQGRGTEFGDALERAMNARQGAVLDTQSSLTPGRSIVVRIGVWGDGICVAIADKTEREAAQRRLRESQDRLLFASALAHKQRGLRDPIEIMDLTCEAVATFLSANRAGFYRMVDDRHLRFDVSWTDGAIPSVTGTIISTDDLGEAYNKSARAGRPVVSNDTTIAGDIGSEAGRYGARAGIAAPIVRQGRWQSGFYLSSATPRVWTPEEVAFVEEIAQTSWDAVERAEAEAEVRLSEERFRLVAESAPVMLWMGDEHGKCVYLNRTQREFWGVSEADVPTFNWGTTVHPDDATVLYEPFQRAMETQTSFTVEARYRRADGAWRILRSQAQPRFAARGAFAGMIGVNVDVTDARAAERELQALNSTLEQRVNAALAEQRSAAEALERAREDLFQAQKMEAVGQLTGGIAHDFNNMLAGIIGAMHLLERRIAAGRFDETGKYIAAALDSANRAAALTSRLLAFGRRQSLDIKAVDINATVKAIEPLISRTLDENIALQVDLDETAPLALTDAHQLESAILNLALNGRDAMPDGGTLTITTRAPAVKPQSGSTLATGEYMEVSVTDTGVGMSAEVLSRAFEPFFTTKPTGAGTGLGLSMVYGFAKQTGGDISIESSEGHGAEVKLYLPVALERIVRPDAKPLTAPSGRGEVVLVVEDDPLVRMLVLDVLRDIGYTVREAHDADAAMPLLASDERIDLLVSDVGLPGLNGRQLADIARHQRPTLKVLFLTGYAEHAAVRSGFLDIGMDLMTKPFSVDALAVKIKQMLGS